MRDRHIPEHDFSDEESSFGPAKYTWEKEPNNLSSLVKLHR